MSRIQGFVRRIPHLCAAIGLLVAGISCSSTEAPPETVSEATATREAGTQAESPSGAPGEPQDQMGRLMRQRKILAQSYAASGQQDMDKGDLSGAYASYAKALELDSRNEAYQQKFSEIQRLLGSGDDAGSALGREENRILVRKQAASIEIQNRTSRARLAAAQEDYDKAAAELEAALEIYEWFPYDLDVDLPRDLLRAELDNVRNLGAEKQRSDAREKALGLMDEKLQESEESKERLAERIEILFTEADNAFARGDYGKAESLLDEILRLDYENDRADSLRRTAIEARHEKANVETRRSFREEWKKTFEDIDAGMVPMTDHVAFPSNWDEISRRRPREFRQEDPSASAEEQEILNKLARLPVAPIFEDTSLREVAQFFQSVTGVNFVVSAAVSANFTEDEQTVTLGELRPLPARDLLNIVTQVKGLAWKIEDGVVKITTVDDLSQDMVLEIYNVRDLVNPINDFPGEEISLQPATGLGLFDEEDLGDDSDTAAINADRLIQLIQENIAPDRWDPPASIIPKQGTLVVRQAREIHRQIRQLLDDLRQTTGVLVAIEARFLSVEDNFLEDVGVDLRGLGDDSGGTGRPGRGRSSDLDDFGVPNTGFGTPDNPRGIGTGNDAGVFYDDGSDGNVRARVENLFDLSLGSEDTLTNSGGLTAQYTFLDDTEIEAIFRAVRKSERNQTLTAPRLLVSNNERASISVINEVTYVKDFDVEIAQAAVIADPIMDIVRDGVILDVKPVVSADRKFVTLELRPTVSQLDRPIPTFATTLGTGPPVAIEVPTLQVQRVRTTVTMPDNATLLLGGLKTAEDRKLESGVPFLRNIPILSFFFGRKGSYKAQKNLLILLKARIILMEENQPTAKGFEPR